MRTRYYGYLNEGESGADSGGGTDSGGDDSQNKPNTGCDSYKDTDVKMWIKCQGEFWKGSAGDCDKFRQIVMGECDKKKTQQERDECGDQGILTYNNCIATIVCQVLNYWFVGGSLTSVCGKYGKDIATIVSWFWTLPVMAVWKDITCEVMAHGTEDCYAYPNEIFPAYKQAFMDLVTALENTWFTARDKVGLLWAPPCLDIQFLGRAVKGMRGEISPNQPFVPVIRATVNQPLVGISQGTYIGAQYNSINIQNDVSDQNAQGKHRVIIHRTWETGTIPECQEGYIDIERAIIELSLWSKVDPHDLNTFASDISAQGDFMNGNSGKFISPAIWSTIDLSDRPPLDYQLEDGNGNIIAESSVPSPLSSPFYPYYNPPEKGIPRVSNIDFPYQSVMNNIPTPNPFRIMYESHGNISSCGDHGTDDIQQCLRLASNVFNGRLQAAKSVMIALTAAIIAQVDHERQVAEALWQKAKASGAASSRAQFGLQSGTSDTEQSTSRSAGSVFAITLFGTIVAGLGALGIYHWYSNKEKVNKLDSKSSGLFEASEPGITKQEKIRWVRKLYEDAIRIDSIHVDEITKNIIGQDVWIWDNLTIKQLNELGPVLLRVSRM